MDIIFSPWCGLILGIIAIKLGEFRSFCIFMDKVSLVPLAWRYPWVRIFSWILVAIFSFWFAIVISFFIEMHTNKLLGNISFIVLLILRWQISGILAMRKIQKKYPQIYEWFKREKEIK